MNKHFIYDVIQTKDGFIWVASDGGLYRFDGVRFKEFNNTNTPVFTSNRFKVLHEDKKGTLWIGTMGGGFYSYENGSFSQIAKEGDSNDNIILSAAEDSLGNMWFGTDGQGLIEVQGNDYTRHDMETWSPSNNIIGLGTDKSGHIMVGGLRTGFYIHDRNQSHYYDPASEITFDVIFHFVYSPAGDLFITTNNGIRIFNEGHVGSITMEELPAGSKVVRDVLFDSKGRFWAVTEVGTYYRESIEDGLWKKVKGVPSSMGTSIIEDTEQNIWIGAHGVGLFRIQDSPFTNIGLEDGLSSETTNSVAVSSKGVIYVGTSEGLNIITETGIEVITSDDGLVGDDISTVYVDGNDVLWGSVFSRGIFSIKDGQLTNYNLVDPEQNAVIRGVYSILEDEKEDVFYFGTSRSGIQKWEDGRTLKQWNHREGLSNSHVHSITIDQEGAVWAATNYAVNRITADSVIVYGFDQGLLTPLVVSLHNDDDPDNSVWLGSYGGGLFRFQHEKFFQFHQENGFPIEAVFQIIEDDGGYFWMTSDQGLYRFDKQEMHEFADGIIDSYTYELFTKQDGLATNSFSSLVQPTAAKGPDGELYFATLKGVIIIDPDKIGRNETSPIIYFDDISVDFEPVNAEAALTLEPEKQSFEISYTALNFKAPEQLRFRYMLENFDNDWIEAGDRRTAFYTNISPGEYTFRVMAQNSDGIWSKEAAILPVRIEAAFYETMWFRILAVLLVTGLIVGFFQYRLLNLKKLLNMRVQIANDLHDEIGSNLSSVILKSRMLETQESPKENLVKGLQDIQLTTQKTAQAMREIIWLINPKHDVVEDVVFQIKDIAESMLGDLERQIESNLDFESAKISSGSRRNLILIYKELLHNIVKHAEAKKVVISFNRDDTAYILSVEDDGKGFDLNTKNGSTHYGLNSLKERALAMKGNLNIESESGKGTKITLRFKNYGSS